MAEAEEWRRGLMMAVACAAAVHLGASVVRAQQGPAVPLKVRMLVAEDARPAAPASPAPPASRDPVTRTAPGTAPAAPPPVARPPIDPLTPLYEGLTSLPEVQIFAVRGLGRLERPDVVSRIAPLLTASDPAVRAEAVNALGQAVSRGDPALVSDLLQRRVPLEPDAFVRGVLARTIGRLPYQTSAQVVDAERAILQALDAPAPVAPRRVRASARGKVARPTMVVSAAALVGVAHGLEALARLRRSVQPLGDAARAQLTALARYGLDARGAEVPVATGREDARRVRRLAMSALTSAGNPDPQSIVSAATDPDAQVRRLALVGAGDVNRDPAVLNLLERRLQDREPSVRIEALRRRAELGGRAACRAAKQAVVDADHHVALAGLEAAGFRCETDVEGVQLVDEMAVPPVDDSAAGGEGWHRPAHALVALAQLTPERTRARLGPFASHPLWHVRLYAARAAGLVGATNVLETLARDANDNVADAALTELVRRVGHRADPWLIAALGRSDGQVVRTAARALAGTPRREEATQALLLALARTTVELRDTSRDVRMALLDRIEETGAKRARVGDELTAYLRDFDPVVAAKAGAILSSWRTTPAVPQPRPLPPAPVPSLELLARLGRTTAVVSMARGGSFRLRLFPVEAPTNVVRFTRLVESRYFDGLTFHRVEPTFVVQGGSPNANEYAGDARYTRDELGLRSHLRGTVGISTRGRDTGDGQIFVNLVDNFRLDHNYTIIGEVIEGMEVVDRVLEGDVIRQIVLVSR